MALQHLQHLQIPNSGRDANTRNLRPYKHPQIRRPPASCLSLVQRLGRRTHRHGFRAVRVPVQGVATRSGATMYQCAPSSPRSRVFQPSSHKRLVRNLGQDYVPGSRQSIRATTDVSQISTPCSVVFQTQPTAGLVKLEFA
jgi:hypothetical protein